MKSLFLSSLLVFALCSFEVVNAHDGEWFKVLCVAGNPDEIIVKLDKDSVKTAYEFAKRGNVDNYRSHMKTLIRNIQQLNHTCLFGRIEDSDYITAVAMFVAGMQEFKHNADMIEASGYPYLYMNTVRGRSYDSNHAVFSLGW